MKLKFCIRPVVALLYGFLSGQTLKAMYHYGHDQVTLDFFVVLLGFVLGLALMGKNKFLPREYE